MKGICCGASRELNGDARVGPRVESIGGDIMQSWRGSIGRAPDTGEGECVGCLTIMGAERLLILLLLLAHPPPG